MGVVFVLIFVAICIEGTQQAKKESAPILRVYAKAIEKAAVPGIGISGPRTRVMFELDSGRRVQLFVPDSILIAVGDMGQLEYRLDTVERFRPVVENSAQQSASVDVTGGTVPTWKRIEMERKRVETDPAKRPNCGVSRNLSE